MKTFDYQLINTSKGYNLSISGNDYKGISHDDACHIIHREATALIYALIDQYYCDVLPTIRESNTDKWRDLKDKYHAYVENGYPFYMVKDQMTVERLKTLLPVIPSNREKAMQTLSQIEQLYNVMATKTDHYQQLDQPAQTVAA